MNIIVILRKDFAGCGFYRMYQPHNHLAKNYGVKVLLTTGLNHLSDEELKKHDLVIWHKAYYDFVDIQRAKDLGLVTIADFDDHWILPKEHIFYKNYEKNGTVVSLHKFIMKVDYVTCTTERLAGEIEKHNRNVQVFPNAMDMNYPGCKVERKQEEQYVFGYLGGHTHLRDVALLNGVQAEMTKQAKDYNFRLFGYDGTPVYSIYANILSDHKRSPNYSVYKGTDIWHYPQFYNFIDCSMVPLEKSFFNSMKSPLKLIEAGFFKKAVIVSPVEPYRELSKHCMTASTKNEWIDACLKLIKDRQRSESMGQSLYEAVQEYDINKVNKKRYKFYSDVLQKRNINSIEKSCRMVAV